MLQDLYSPPILIYRQLLGQSLVMTCAKQNGFSFKSLKSKQSYTETQNWEQREANQIFAF